jgi:hypothetical protein
METMWGPDSPERVQKWAGQKRRKGMHGKEKTPEKGQKAAKGKKPGFPPKKGLAQPAFDFKKLSSAGRKAEA